MTGSRTAVLWSACIMLTLAGCKGDEGPAGPAGPAGPDRIRFSLEITRQDAPQPPVNPAAGSMSVEFAMTLGGEIPYVLVNGHSMEPFEYLANIIYAFKRIPYDDTVALDIHLGDRHISRTLEAPTNPDLVACNGVEFHQNRPNRVSPAEQLVFSWTGGDYDQATGHLTYLLNGQLVRRLFTTDSTSAVFSLDPNVVHFGLVLKVARGVLLSPGTVPNIRTEWAEGYTTWIAPERSYNGFIQRSDTTAVQWSPAVAPVPLHARLADMMP